jgi:uncharacterized protein
MPTLEQARLWYDADDPVHGFDHVLRVLRLAEQLALQEGADLEIVRAAALMHDAQGERTFGDVQPGNERDDHHLRSADFAGQVLRQEGWPEPRIEAVQHCIKAHRFRDESTRPETLEARVVFDADKLDAIGATGAARAIAFAASAGQPFYAKPSAGFLACGQTEPGEPHSAYHEYLFKLVKIRERLLTSSGQALAESRQRRMVDYFEGLSQEMET